MGNQLVKIIINEDGIPEINPQWCLVDPANLTGPATLCTGEYIGSGESSCTYKEKYTKRGGITCELCLKKLKEYKSVRL